MPAQKITKPWQGLYKPKVGTWLFASGALWLMMAAALTGCLQGANYQRPSLEVPADWEQLSGRDPKTGIPINSQQVPNATWWQAFQNEELTAVIERALERNHDVRQAALRVLEGRAIVMSAGAGLYPQANVQGAYTRIEISKNTVAGPSKTVAAVVEVMLKKGVPLEHILVDSYGI